MAKSSLTQNLRATQKSTAVHTPVTKSLHATQRLTSAHVTATRSPAVPRATTRFHAASPPKGGGSSPSGQLTTLFRFPSMDFMCYGGNFKLIGIIRLYSLWFIVGRVSSYWCSDFLQRQTWIVLGHTFFFFFFLDLFIFYWLIDWLLCWVFVSVLGLSLVVASGGHSSSRCAGLSPSRPLLLRSAGSRHAGSVIVAHGPSCSAACGIFPDQGSNPCPLH